MSQQVLSLQVITATVDASGDYSESAAVAVSIGGDLKQLEGYKKMAYTELINKEVYQFECYDHAALALGSTAAWGSVNLIIYAVTKNFDGSFTNRVKVILYKK